MRTAICAPPSTVGIGGFARQSTAHGRRHIADLGRVGAPGVGPSGDGVLCR